MSRGLTAETIRDDVALAALAPEWWDLWRRVPSAAPFQSPAWITPWRKAFHGGELLAVAVRRGTRLVGLGSFYIEQGAERRLLPLGVSLGDHLDVLLDPETEEEAGLALVDRMWRERESWDLWSLEDLAPEAAGLRLPAPPDCVDLIEKQSPCPVLALPENFEAFRAGLSARKRRKLAMAGNRAARRGGADVERGRGADLLDALFALHDRRWRSRGERGIFGDERVESFFREAFSSLERRGLLRLFAIRIGDRRAAVYCGFRHGGRAYAYLSGFDPDFARESPGVLLVAQAIEDALREGAREFHFLRGAETYKYEWGAVDRWNHRRSFRRRR